LEDGHQEYLDAEFAASDPDRGAGTGAQAGNDGNTDDGDACDSDCGSVGVPTVSVWGLLILALMLATAAKIHFNRREVAVQ